MAVWRTAKTTGVEQGELIHKFAVSLGEADLGLNVVGPTAPQFRCSPCISFVPKAIQSVLR